jgi:predicted DNA-binding transcriptional regulator AlpA
MEQHNTADMPRPVSETHLTDEQVARVTGKSLETLKRWRREGRAPSFIRVGRTPWYPRAAVNALINPGLQPSAQP